jgi:hypothetical protein
MGPDQSTLLATTSSQLAFVIRTCAAEPGRTRFDPKALEPDKLGQHLGTDERR